MPLLPAACFAAGEKETHFGGEFEMLVDIFSKGLDGSVEGLGGAAADQLTVAADTIRRFFELLAMGTDMHERVHAIAALQRDSHGFLTRSSS